MHKKLCMVTAPASICKYRCVGIRNFKPLLVVKPKPELSEYFKFHPHQPETTKFNSKMYIFDDERRLQRLWLSYCEEKKAIFWNVCILVLDFWI